MDLLTAVGRARPSGTAAEPAGLVHEALWCRDPRDSTVALARFLRAGIALSEPVLVAAPAARLEALHSTLGAERAGVQFVDMAQVGRNPGRIIPSVLYAFVQAHPGRRVRVVTEAAWPGRSAAECRAVVQHEALVNLALAEHEVSILCPYDCCGLGAPALARARQTHPVLVEGCRREPSTEYRDPRAVADDSLRFLPEPPELWGDMRVFRCAADLPGVRTFVEHLALRAGLRGDRVIDLCLAVTEVATNTLVHTPAAGVLSVWQDSKTDTLICEINDSGQLRDRLIGRIPPPPSQPHGRGLLLVNQLCDLVEIPTGRIGTGTTVRLHMALR